MYVCGGSGCGAYICSIQTLRQTDIEVLLGDLNLVVCQGLLGIPNWKWVGHGLDVISVDKWRTIELRPRKATYT